MVAPLIGGLISGGISLISGLFGRKDAKKKVKSDEKAIAAANAANAYQAEMTRLRAKEAAKIPIVTTQASGVDMGGFLKAAEAGGFNPLTFLRSGALGSFTRTLTSVTGSTAMEAALAGAGNGGGGASVMPVMSNVNVPGIGSIAANAFGAGFNTYLDLDSQRKAESYQAAMLEAQIHGMGTKPTSGGKGYTPSGVFTGGIIQKGDNAALSTSQYAKGKTFKNPGDTLWIFGRPFQTAPTTSNADDFETRGGEAAGWLGGAAAMANDYYLNSDPQSRALMDFVSMTPGEAGKTMVDWYSGALSRTKGRIVDAPSLGAEYIKSISASPTNPGQTWGEIYNDWQKALSW